VLVSVVAVVAAVAVCSLLFFCAAGSEVLAAGEAEATTGEIKITAIISDPSQSSQKPEARGFWLLCYGVQGER
jgi:hypothetical protein